MLPDVPHNDNRVDADMLDDRKLQQRERDIDAMADELRGRTDLLFLALDTRKGMLDIHAQLMQINARLKACTSRAERELLSRELRGVMESHKDASERFQAIEAAMSEETRYKLWQEIL